MNTKTLKQLDILNGGLRLTNSDRKKDGVMRFNNTTKKFEMYTGTTDIDGNEWLNIIPGVASSSNLGNVKVGDNLFIDSSTGKMNAISVGPSLFYQHIVTVSKYDIPFEQHITTSLPGDTVVKGGSGDFTSIASAISFIENLNSSDYPRDSDNEWLILVAPGTYKENFSLLPYISIKGYGKETTFIEPDESSASGATHIKMTTDSSLFDLTLRFDNSLDLLNLILMDVDSDYGRSSVSTTNFTNKTLIKNVNFELTEINSIKCIKLTKGELLLEDSFISLNQDEFNSAQDSDINIFNLSGSTNLEVISSKINLKSNHQDLSCFYSDGAKITILNSFIDATESLDQNISSSSTNNIFKSYSSDIVVRNSQIINKTLNGINFDLLDSSSTSMFEISNSDIVSASIASNTFSLKVLNETTASGIRLKLNNVRGLKMKDLNYKISHISYSSSVFTLKLDSDRNYSDTTFKYETAEDITSESIVKVISSGGNKYVFNNSSTYNSDLKYILNNGTYVFKNVPGPPHSHPMAILNAGKTSLISYTGDSSKKLSKTVSGTTADGTYDFYHGDITVTVSGDFGNVSIYCYYHGYMGGENLLFYGNTLDINILNTVSLANTYLRANSQIINCSSHNYLIETNNVTKEEADYNITGNSLVELNNYNVIHVSKDKGDFNTVSQALKSLGQIDTNLRYLIKVHTGVYTETEQIDLSNRSNINIVGDSKNDTEIIFKFSTLPSDYVLIHGSNGNIENLKITFHNSDLLSSKLSIMKFVSKDVNIRNLSFDIISNNVNVIELSSCGDSNILENIDITIKYYFQEDQGGAIDKVNGLYCSNSNLIKSKNLDINISAHTTFKSSYNNTGKTIDNIYLNNSRIEGINTNLELTTELANSNLILSEESITNNFNNYIYGDTLILNSSESTAYILKNTTTGRFILINSNILGDFNGNNIFTTGSVLTNSTDNEVHSYHTAVLSNNKDSVLIGNDAGKNTMGKSGERNILVGKEAGKLIESGNDNISIGNSSGSTIVTKSNNTLIGNNSGENLDDDSAVMIGYKSGSNATKKNLFLGTYSGFNITGENNVILGNNLLDTSSLTNKEIDDNIFVGNDAGTESSGNDNVFIGEGSGILDTGSKSVSIGNYTASNNKYDKEITTQSTGYNVNIGYLAGEELISGTKSINIGAGAGQKNNKSENIFVGYKTGNNVTGTKNIFMGNNSGENAKGSNNIGIGDSSLIGNSSESDTGSNNVALGLSAGKYVKSDNNILIGAEAASAEKTIGTENIVIGYQSGKLMGITVSGAGPTSNIFMGANAGNNSQGDNNIYIGKNSGTQNSSGSGNVYLGYNTSINTTNGENGVIIGYEAGKNVSNVNSTVLVGYQSGFNLGGTTNTCVGFKSCLVGTNNNTTLGYQSAMNASGSENTVIGANSGTTLKSSNNVVVGSSSLTSTLNTGKDGNTVIGYSSGQKIVEGGNTYIGNEAGKNNAGTDNVIIGDNASVYTSEKSTQDNVIIGKKAGENLNGNYNTVVGSNAGVSSITNQINNNLLMGYKAGTLNDKFNNLLVMGNNSGGALEDEGNKTYYDDIENLIIGNNSVNSVKTHGNMVIGNNVGSSLTDGESNTLIGEKTGDNLVTGNNNLFLGSSRSLIFQKVSTSSFDMSNTYYDETSSDPIILRWTSSLFEEVLSPVHVTGNTSGIIEFIVETPTISGKTLGLKSKTTLDDYRFNSVTPHTSNTNNLAMDLAGDTGSNQLKNKSFIRNFGCNCWGEYLDEDNNTLVPELEPSEETFTSKQDYFDELNTTNYKKNNFPIKFSPDDILEITFTQSSTVKNIIVKVYAIIQTIKKKVSGTIDKDTISKSDLSALYSSNVYEVMDERIYFDLLKDDSIGTTNFAVDDETGVTIKYISSAGHRNTVGSNNIFMGQESGNSNLGENNLFLGIKSGKHSQIGNNNVSIGNNSGELLREGENNTNLGDSAGRFLSSTGNVCLGKEAGRNAETTSSSILIGENSGKSLSGNTNVIIGNKAGENLTTNTNNILLGDNVKYNSTTGDNNVVIGNGIDSESADSSNMFMVGNKALTTVRSMLGGYAIHNKHLYIPVENVMCFTHDDLLRVYDKSDPSTFNYLNTVMGEDLYVKPHKSIIHTFPKNSCQLIKGTDYVELRDYSLQLLNISFLDNTVTETDITGSTFNNKRPIISLERIGISTNSINNSIYEIYKLPTLSADGTYHTISMKKLKSDEQKFEITEIVPETRDVLSNAQVRVNNNVLVLSDDSITDNGHGRYKNTENIYGDGNRTILSITDNMIIERVVSGVITDTDLEAQTATNTLALTVPNASEIFKVGDTVSRLTNNNVANFDQTGFKILELTSTTVKIHQYTSPDIVYEDINKRAGKGHRLRLVKETHSNKQLVGNFNNNKLVVNGEKTDLASNASVIVNGSLALTDFLQLNASDGYANDLTLANGQSIIWLQEPIRSSYTRASSNNPVNTGSNIITITTDSHIIKANDLVLYQTDGTAIGGLSDGTEYYVDKDLSTSSSSPTTEIKFETGFRSGSHVELTDQGEGNHTFTLIGLTIYTTSSTSGDTYITSNEIRRASHGLNTGDLIKYEKNTGEITSLTDDTEYYVIKTDTDKFKLATTSVNAFGGTAISISAGTAGYSVIRIMTAPQLKINYKDSGGTVHNKNILLF